MVVVNGKDYSNHFSVMEIASAIFNAVVSLYDYDFEHYDYD